MMEVADGFKQLTIDQVDLWAQVAQSLTRFNSFGESYVPSGKQIYTESNLNLRFCAQPLNSDSEKIQLNPNLPSIELGTAIVSTDTGVLDAMTLVASSNFGTRMIVQGTLPIPTGVRNYQKRLRQLGIAVTISSTPTAEDLMLNFETAFPGFTDWAGAAGLRVGFRARAVDIGTGLSSAWAYAEAIITEA